VLRKAMRSLRAASKGKNQMLADISAGKGGEDRWIWQAWGLGRGSLGRLKTRGGEQLGGKKKKGEGSVAEGPGAADEKNLSCNYLKGHLKKEVGARGDDKTKKGGVRKNSNRIITSDRVTEIGNSAIQLEELKGPDIENPKKKPKTTCEFLTKASFCKKKGEPNPSN